MITTTLALLLINHQDTPTDIPKPDLPKSAICVVCDANGEGHGEEKLAAGVKYKGKTYYFCSTKEVATFKADPEAFMPPILPRPMPNFELADTTGTVWNATKMKDKLVIIDFWATWCGPCKEMKPIIEKTHTKYREKGLEVLSVSIDEKNETLVNYLKKNKFQNPVLFDSSQTWAEWKVRVIPAFFILKNGQIVDQWVGKKSQKEIDAVVEKQLQSN
ncbi:MAG: thioredoxin domain-containing protein [Fimbriimonadaceae bacterium]